MTPGGPASRESFWRSEFDGVNPLPLPFTISLAEDEAPPRFEEPLSVAPSRWPLAPAAPEARRSLLLAGVALVLAHSTGSRDVCVSVETGDDRVGTLPLALSLSATPLGSWLGEIEQRVRELEAHAAPAAEIRRWAGLSAALPECSVEVGTDAHLPSSRSEFPALRIVGGPHVELFFDRSRLESGDAARFAVHLRIALDAMLADPSRSALDISILEPGERRQLVAWSSGGDPFPSAPWQEAFLDSCARYPDAIAVSDPLGRISYRELAARSAWIASELIARSITPGDVVAVALPSSVTAIAALVGILRSGAAYTAIAPEDPPARCRFVLRNSGARLVLARAGDERFRGDVEKDVDVLLMEDALRASPSIGALPDAPPSTGSDPAYVTYTSGTSGMPKGVVTTSANLGHYAREAGSWYGLGPGDVVLNFASLAFDFSVAEIFPALATGAAVVPYDEHFHGTSEAFWRACAEAGITVLMLPTSLWAAVAEDVTQDGEAVPASVRLVSVGGERADPSMVSRWLSSVPQIRLVNGYGPTEATVEAARSILSERDWGADPGWRREVPIGRPAAGVDVYVIDRVGSRPEPAPVGVPGPIWIGGAGVATGYLHDPARTEAVFVEASIGDRPERLFATADVGRYLPTGEVEFLGRSDRMLKIRGFRVEPGEIEAALERRADVRRALVGGVEAEDGDVRLVAYVVPSADPVPDPVLRSFLRAALPAHLVPSEIAQVAEVPMLGNGKPDFKAIMARSSKGSDPRTASPGPAASSEGTALGRMAGIWSQLLGSGPLDADDDFFECGGHSILAMRLAARIRKGFGVSLTLEEIFDHPRLRQLATMVDQRATERPGASRGS